MLTFQFYNEGEVQYFFKVAINSYLQGYLPCNELLPVATQTFDFPVTQLGSIGNEKACTHAKLEGIVSFKKFDRKPEYPLIAEGNYSVTTEPPQYRERVVYDTHIYRLGERWVCKTYATREGKPAVFNKTFVYLVVPYGNSYRLSYLRVTFDADDDYLSTVHLDRTTNSVCRFTTSGTGARLSRSSCSALLNVIRKLYLPYRETLYDEDFAQLSDDCAANARYLDCNLPMLARELKNLRASTEAFVELFYGKINTKMLANVYLSSKYGARLTVRDARTVLTELDNRIGQQELAGKVHSRTSRVINVGVGTNRNVSWQYERVLTIAYHQNPWDVAQRCFHEAANWDALFSLQNIWDFIPYSFVIDWFLDVESALVRLDNQAYWHTLHVDTVVSSEKKTADLDASWFYPDAEGIITATFYDRKVSTIVPTGSPRLNPTLEFTNHVPELTALFRQRIR